MQSKKPIYKKPREQINTFEESTWHANDTPMFENEHCAVFKDLYPCVTGHLLFIPKQNNAQTVSEAYKLAYYCGEEWIKEGKIIIFPSWLMHYVDPNPNDSTRVSIAFNAKYISNYEYSEK